MKIYLTNYTKTCKGILKHNYQKYIALLYSISLVFENHIRYSISSHIFITHTKKNPIAIIHRSNIFAKVFFVVVPKAITKEKN